MYSSNNEYILDIIKICKLCVSGTEPYSESLKRMRGNESGSDSFPTLLALKNIFNLSDCEMFCVMLAFGCELDGGLKNQMKELCGSPLPSFDVAFAIWGRENAILPYESVCFAHSESTLSLFLLEDRGYCAVMMHAPLKLRENILCFLTGGRISSTRFYGFFRLYEALPLHQAAFARICGFASAVLKGEETGYIYLKGKMGAGRKGLAARVAAEFGLSLIRISLKDLPSGKDACRRLGCELAADTALAGASLYVEEYAPEHGESLRVLLGFLPKQGFLLFIAGDAASFPPPLEGRIPFADSVGALSSEDMRLAAEHFSKAPLHGKFPDYLRLSLSELMQSMQNARLRAAENGSQAVTAEDFIASARQVGEQITNAQTLETNIALDDVMLAPDTREKLELFCQFIRKSETVRNQWGFSHLNHYGKGIVGLFCGASGTGKTMAANGIANTLGLRLLRIDISKIFDKYIGETEKRLSQLFDEADSQNCILFFDEADALFSKRTDVSSSHDRYANIETSYLLQRIEEFNGVIILSTNLFQNFDEAFMRRITVIARFNMPDEDLRYKMWKSFFPAQAPVSEDVDFMELARELELSPAIIKSAAFTAAVLASEGDGAVTMRHILSALENELCKWGKESVLAGFHM